MTSDEGQEVIDYCERKGVKIAAGFMMRFGSHVMSMKKAIAEGGVFRRGRLRLLAVPASGVRMSPATGGSGPAKAGGRRR